MFCNETEYSCRLHTIVQIIRAIVGTLVELVYYCFELLLTVFELIGVKTDPEKQQITTQITNLLALLKNKFISLFNEIGDLLYKILFDGPMGAWLITMIKAVCNFLDLLFSDVVYVILCWTRSVSIWEAKNTSTTASAPTAPSSFSSQRPVAAAAAGRAFIARQSASTPIGRSIRRTAARSRVHEAYYFNAPPLLGLVKL